jgi:hypothetical protein
MSTIITALAVIALIGLMIFVVRIAHNRDQKKEKLNELKAPENTNTP